MVVLKLLKINFISEVKELYTKNYKTLMKILKTSKINKTICL